MNKIEFLTELRKKLKRLPQNEIENALSYYEEYFNDAGEENEQKVILELGSPAVVASKIIGEFAVNDAELSKKKGLKPLWIVILAICASPIAFPVAFAVVIVALALLFSLFMIFLSFGISAVAFIVSGIASLIAGIWALFNNPSTGLFFIGYSLLTVSIGISVVIGTIKLSKISFLGIQKLLGKYLIRRGTK